MADQDQSVRTYYVLVTLSEHGPLSKQKVCDRLDIDRSDMVRLIDVLEGRGHVERTRDREDRRRYQLTLTPRGKKAVGRCDAILAAVTDDVLAALSPDERRTLHRLTLRALGYPAEIPEMVVVVPALAERQ